MGGAQLEHRVAEEFQAFIVLVSSVFVRKRRMQQSCPQKSNIVKKVSDALLQFFELSAVPVFEIHYF